MIRSQENKGNSAQDSTDEATGEEDDSDDRTVIQATGGQQEISSDTDYTDSLFPNDSLFNSRHLSVLTDTMTWPVLETIDW